MTDVNSNSANLITADYKQREYHSAHGASQHFHANTMDTDPHANRSPLLMYNLNPDVLSAPPSTKFKLSNKINVNKYINIIEKRLKCFKKTNQSLDN